MDFKENHRRIKDVEQLMAILDVELIDLRNAFKKNQCALAGFLEDLEKKSLASANNSHPHSMRQTLFSIADVLRGIINNIRSGIK